MEDIVNLITQNGIGVICVGFMIYFMSTALKEMNSILNDVKNTLVAVELSLTSLTSRVEKIEDKIKSDINE